MVRDDCDTLEEGSLSRTQCEAIFWMVSSFPYCPKNGCLFFRFLSAHKIFICLSQIPRLWWYQKIKVIIKAGISIQQWNTKYGMPLLYLKKTVNYGKRQVRNIYFNIQWKLLLHYILFLSLVNVTYFWNTITYNNMLAAFSDRPYLSSKF